MRRVTWAVLAVVLVLTGCAAIPVSGTVQNGATDQPSNPSIVFLPQSPVSNASRQDIVNGFIQAASAGGDFAVAKEFLTPAFARAWKPLSSVLIQEQTATPSVTGPDELRLRVPTSAQIGPAGVYTSAPKTVPLDFHLTQVKGQWRIDKCPDGIVLAPTVFQKTYVQQQVQFFDQTWSRLVPDVRWFPQRSDQLTGIVAALASGPSGPLAGAGVTENALQGAGVQKVVTGLNGVTIVRLSVDRTPSTQVTDRMQQQLIRSLPSLQSPSALQLIVNGRVAPETRTLAAQAPAQQSAAIVQGHFGALSPSGRLTEDRTLGKQIVALKPQAVTISPRQKLAAVLGHLQSTPQSAQQKEQEVVVVGEGQPKVVDRRPNLIDPTLDQRGWTYSVPMDDPSGLEAFTSKGRPVPVAGDLGTGSVVAIEASPDGTRMLVLINSATGPSAFVAGIERRADGTPVGLTSSRYPVAADAGTGLDATWYDDGSVAVLIQSLDGQTVRVTKQNLGALSAPLGSPSGASTIVGTAVPLPGVPLLVQLQGGDVYGWQDNEWQSPFTNPVVASVLAVQR